MPLTPEITVRAVNLSLIHKDPFDRLIIATTLEYGAKLASVDNLYQITKERQQIEHPVWNLYRQGKQ